MSKSTLHPSVKEFKEFVNKYPQLRQEIRNNEMPLQEYYEKWALLGEDDPVWDKYKNNVSDQSTNEQGGVQGEFFSQIMSMAKNMDITKVQQHVEQVSIAIQTIQTILGQYKQSQTNEHSQDRSNNLFQIFRD